MENRAKYVLTITFTLLLISSGAALVEERTVSWGQENWEQFENTLDNCESSNCITDDSLSSVEMDHLSLTIDTGNNGFCGTGGVQKDIVVPSGENVGLAISLDKAELDNWGGRVGIKANDEWLMTFSSEGGQSRTVNPEGAQLGSDSVYYADISEYSGEEVTFKVATEDTSQEWCNMPDHEQSIELNSFYIATPIKNGEFTSSDGWEKFQRNDVNCEDRYSCQSDDIQPLETNGISDGQLVLDTGIDEFGGGHCGNYGREQWVYVPKADTINLNFEASAELDPWGGNIGVKFGQDWIFTFNDSRGNGQKSYEMQERTRDISDYSGEYVRMRIVQEDQSGDWCDMSDHDRRMVVESVGFETSGDSGDEANRPPSASLESQRFAGTTVSFDASGTTDPDNGQGDLETRWDWNNDGTWDEGWVSVMEASHTYPESTSQATTKVKVRDGDGGTDTATVSVNFGSSDDGDSGGESGDLVIPAEGWKVVTFTSDVDKSKFSDCGSSATAYYAGDSLGFLRTADLTASGTLESGSYFIHSTSQTDCSLSDVEVDNSGDTGTLEIPSNGWSVTTISEGVSKSEFSGCGDSSTAYYAGDSLGFLRTADLTASGTLESGSYFIHSTSESSCSVGLPDSSGDGDDSDGDTGGDDSDDGDTEYASAEEEWCQTNGNGQALSTFRDDVDAGCKSQDTMLGVSGGSTYYGANNNGMSCADAKGYVCEE